MRQTIIATVVAAWIAGATAHADLMPTTGVETGARRPARGLQCPDRSRSKASGRLFRLVGADWDVRSRGLLPEGQGSIEPSSDGPRLHVLADRQNGAGLCLCALLGLGLCRAAPCVKSVKRWSWGALPDWYHDSGPFQIGHSVAVPPDCLCPGLLCSFLPPPGIGADPTPHHDGQDVAPLWRKAQFVPMVLAPRGPPFLPRRL